jgi:hypothetical protein
MLFHTATKDQLSACKSLVTKGHHGPMRRLKTGKTRQQVELGAVESADKAAKGKVEKDLYESERQGWQYARRDEIDREFERCCIQRL